MNYIDTQPQQAPRTKLWQGAERDTPRSGFRSMLPDNAYSRQDRIVQTGRDNSRVKDLEMELVHYIGMRY